MIKRDRDLVTREELMGRLASIERRRDALLIRLG
jgi:hypothetical protein